MRKPSPNFVSQTAAQHGYPATDYGWHRYRYIPIPNKNVVAPEKCTVKSVNLNAGDCGKMIELQAGTRTYRMCHFEHVRAGIHVGQKLNEGDLVGIMGKTGLAYGVHLHLVILVSGKRVPDPDAWLNKKIAEWQAAQAPKPLYPRAVTVTSASGANVRSAPRLSAPLAGSKTLVKGDVFTSVGLVSGDTVAGNNKWHKSSKGNYVWSGNTNVK